MPPGGDELQELEDPDQDNCNRRGHPTPLGVGEAKGKPDQNEGKRMFAVLSEIGMGAEICGAERGKSDGSGEEPGKKPENKVHSARTAQCRSAAKTGTHQVAG